MNQILGVFDGVEGSLRVFEELSFQRIRDMERKEILLYFEEMGFKMSQTTRILVMLLSYGLIEIRRLEESPAETYYELTAAGCVVANIIQELAMVLNRLVIP